MNFKSKIHDNCYLRKAILACLLILTVSVFYACGPKILSDKYVSSDKCECVNMEAINEQIGIYVEEGKIRRDQADAKKEDLEKDLQSFKKGQIKCEDLQKKAAYHLN